MTQKGTNCWTSLGVTLGAILRSTMPTRCDSRRPHGGRRDEPQIVNGQQTTRVLEEAGTKARKVSVLVRVIEVPPELAGELSGDGSLTGQIVKATNRQNRISSADLKSNERKQVWLQQELEQLGYRYIRKREARAETAAGPRAKIQLKKEWLARAVASCEYDTWGLKGQEPLFAEYYSKIFASKDPWYYALCYELFDRITVMSKKSSVRTWARFAAIRFVWKQLGVDLRRNRRLVVRSLQRSGKRDAIVQALDKVLSVVLAESVAYYDKKGENLAGEREDVQKFFKRADAYGSFETWWRSRNNTHRADFQDAKRQLLRAMKSVSE